jgi:hypothetical protein
MKKILLNKKTVNAIKDFAQRKAGYSGWPETPSAMKTVFPVCLG